MYSRRTRIPRLLVVRTYLNNYFAMYTHLTRSHIYAGIPSLTCSGLRNILIIILLCMVV